eukprot:c21984_g1_i1 orf=141-524(+)
MPWSCLEHGMPNFYPCYAACMWQLIECVLVSFCHERHPVFISINQYWQCQFSCRLTQGHNLLLHGSVSLYIDRVKIAQMATLFAFRTFTGLISSMGGTEMALPELLTLSATGLNDFKHKFICFLRVD